MEGANHLLVPAATGEADEYPSLRADKNQPQVIAALVALAEGHANHLEYMCALVRLNRRTP